MSIKLRFALLLGVLLLIFLGSLGVLRHLENRQLAEALANSQIDATNTLERWLDLNGTGLRQFAEDYSRWDDMVTFAKSPDQAWAEINLRQSMESFKLHMIWVLSPQGQLIYHAHQDDHEAPQPLPASDWLGLVADNPFPHFYIKHDGDLLEIRAAPIQPSADADRTALPAGWLLVARVWNREHLRALGKLTESSVVLDEHSAPAPVENQSRARLTIMRPLSDWRGEIVGVLRVTREMPAIAQRLRNDVFEARVFIFFGLLVMGALALSLHNWVLKPLNAIGESLAQQDAAPLHDLISRKNELSRIASQLELAYDQQRELVREVGERARLGRDLHDGVIQSIYAAGMGLAAARTLIHRDPDEAARSIDQVRAALNETIRDVRNFITGLEPEALQSRTFTAAVTSLFDFFTSFGSPARDLDIDESAADRLHLAARTAALQIVRECTSNAFRHGRARCVQVSLRLADDRKAIRLVVSDDGTGFDPATVRRGRGLDNIVERARTLGATATITSEPGKGTRTTVLFPVSDLPHS